MKKKKKKELYPVVKEMRGRLCVYYRFGEEVPLLDRVVIAVVIDGEGVAMVTPDKIEKKKKNLFSTLISFDFKTPW